MTYVIDTSSWQQFFGCYGRERFPTLWKLFGGLVAGGKITSIRHVLREIENRDKNNGELDWANLHPELFPKVSERESQFLREIYAVPRFGHVVPTVIRADYADEDQDEDQDEDSDADADPFLIARANAIDGMVITQERQRGNRVSIPSICLHFDIKCGTLDDLMVAEGWSFLSHSPLR